MAKASEIKRGLELIIKYNADTMFCSKHDQIWCGDHYVTTNSMTPNEIEEMTKLGWFESEESWSHYT